MLLKPEQIERIISAVGDRYRGNPDRDALQGNLEGVIHVWQLSSSADSDHEAREKHKLFAAIAEHGSKLEPSANAGQSTFCMGRRNSQSNSQV